MMMRAVKDVGIALALAACVTFVGGQAALSQSSPGLVFGQVPTPAQWNSYFAAKQDWLGANPCIVSGCVMTGELTTTASSAGSAGFTLPPGVAPTNPVNGDLWMTSTQFFARVNGVSVALLGSSAASFAATNPLAVTFPGGVVTYALNFNGSLVLDGTNKLGINLGNPNQWTAAQTINLNAVGLPAADAGTALQVGGADATIARIEVTAFGASPFFTGRRADGTNASPTAVVAGDLLVGIGGQGYNGTSWVASAAASVELQSNQTWTTAALGTRIDLRTTPNGSTTLATVCRIENDAGVTCPNTVTGGDKGAGTINVSGGYYVGGTNIAPTPGGAALTATNDTNVTVALGGSPSTALVNAASLTLGWTGTLAVSRGGVGAGTLTAHAVLLGEGTAAVAFATTGTGGRLLIDQGAAADPAFTAMSGDATIAAGGALTIGANAVTYAKFQQVAASSLVGNPTGSLANAQGITLDSTLSFSGSTLKCTTATTTQIGCVKPDGTTITISAGTITASGASATSVNAAGPTTATTITNSNANDFLFDVRSGGTDYLSHTGSPYMPMAATFGAV